MQLPEIVSPEVFEKANQALREREKAATHERDALAAERRRLPMTEIPAGFEFDGPDRRVTLADLFEGRPQLILYHYWHPAGGEPCGGCSMFTDQIGHLAHINARDVTLALVSTAPQDQIEDYKRRMGSRAAAARCSPTRSASSRT